MDPNSNLTKGVAHLLPAERSLGLDDEAIYAEQGLSPIFLGSTKYVSMISGGQRIDCLLCKALDLRTNEPFVFRVTPLNHYVIIPQTAMNYNNGSLLRDLINRVGPKYSFETQMFNGDLKKTMDVTIFVMRTRGDYETFIRCANPIITRAVSDDVYTFGDEDIHEGNTVALYNNILNSRTYYVKRTETASYAPSEFIFDEARNSKSLMNLNQIIPHIKREAAFDIETVFNVANIQEDLQCPAFTKSYFANLRETEALYCALRLECGEHFTVPAPKNDSVVQKLHEINSISLVVCNYAQPKTKGDKTTHRKDFNVYYTTSAAAMDMEPIPTEHLLIDYDRINFIPCDNEFIMIGRFLACLLKNVDVLYVYNAHFDVAVLRQRIAFYSHPRMGPFCCNAHKNISIQDGRKLSDMWERFLSAHPSFHKGTILLGTEELQKRYKGYLCASANVIRGSADWDAKKALLGAMRGQFNTNKSTIQNLKVNCFGTDIVDLMYMTHQGVFENKTGKLEDKAEKVLSIYRPNKAKVKTHKMQGVAYEDLDDAYRAGGTDLTKCLVYNLIDSQLTVRIAKCIQPVEEYIFRQISALNMDIMVHTRGTGNFSGFVQSTKAVEIPRHKARIDNNIVLATGKKKMCLFKPLLNERIGGFVMEPLTGISFMQPKQSFEVCLDFAALYPSNMCDLNISIESIVDHAHMDKVTEFVGYDWSGLEGGFEKCTLLMSVDRTNPEAPTLKRHFSDTAASLKRYLGMRNFHKKAMKKAQSEGDTDTYVFHNRLQSEMKIQANAHYGVSPNTCSLMITTQGQHKIKFVNKALVNLQFGTHGLFPNYGDTDSTMLFTPPDDTQSEIKLKVDGIFVDESSFTPELRDYVIKGQSKALVAELEARFISIDTFINSFLGAIESVMLDDALGRLVISSSDGTINRSYQPEIGGPWFIKDPKTGHPMNVSEPFLDGMINKLEFEDASSVACHVGKKQVC
nr:DNA polymerase catalytic subunit [Salmonid herpesvirus 1]